MPDHPPPFRSAHSARSAWHRGRSGSRDRLEEEQWSVLGQWFGIAPDTLRTADRPSISDQTVGAGLRPVMDELGLIDRQRSQTLKEHWGETVGALIAQHSRPVAFHRGILTVAVDHPGWLQEFQRFHKASMLHSLAGKFEPGWVRDIRFRIG